MQDEMCNRAARVCTELIKSSGEVCMQCQKAVNILSTKSAQKYCFVHCKSAFLHYPHSLIDGVDVEASVQAC